MDRSRAVSIALVTLSVVLIVAGWTRELPIPLVRAACLVLLVLAVVGVVVSRGLGRVAPVVVLVLAVGALDATRGGETGESGEFSAFVVQHVVGPLVLLPSLAALLLVRTPDRRPRDGV